jgi:hypothetical protein
VEENHAEAVGRPLPSAASTSDIMLCRHDS